VRSAFSERLLPPLEVTDGCYEECDGILEPTESSVAIIAKEATGNSGPVVVVEGQSATSSTATLVPFANPADGTLAILLLEKSLVFLARVTVPTRLGLLVRQDQTIATAVRPVGKPGVIGTNLLSPTALTFHQTVANSSVVDPIKSLPNKVRPDRAERNACPSGNLADRQAVAEQVRSRIHRRYLKRKQQCSPVAN